MQDDYYEILGIGDLKFNAGESEIKKAYRNIALIYHPDKAG
jgi:curved DNA-binding protein CbpA